MVVFTSTNSCPSEKFEEVGVASERHTSETHHVPGGWPLGRALAVNCDIAAFIQETRFPWYA